MSVFLTFYDSVYQKIVVRHPLIKKLIFTPEFQRLKNINQLGMLSLLRASTRHTRFSHCLGVFYLINKLFQRDIFHKISEKSKLEIKIAGLLHDIGHGPFSHSFEKIIPDFVHEKYSCKLIRNPQGNIFPLLKEHNLNVDRICDLILTRAKNDWGQTLISGQFDFDRLDYLIRDRHATGWQLNPGDANWLIDNLQFKNNELVFHERGMLYVENYLIFRFYIYQQLFWNQKSLFLEGVLANVFQRMRDLKEKINLDCLNSKFQFILNNKLPAIKIFKNLDDHDLYVFLKKIHSEAVDPILRILTTILLLPPTDYEELFSDNSTVLKSIPVLERKYFTYSFDQKITIYQAGKNEIKFIDDSGKVKEMSKSSLFFNESKIYREKTTIYLNPRFQFLKKFLKTNLK